MDCLLFKKTRSQENKAKIYGWEYFYNGGNIRWRALEEILADIQQPERAQPVRRRRSRQRRNEAELRVEQPQVQGDIVEQIHNFNEVNPFI